MREGFPGGEINYLNVGNYLAKRIGNLFSLSCGRGDDRHRFTGFLNK